MMHKRTTVTFRGAAVAAVTTAAGAALWSLASCTGSPGAPAPDDANTITDGPTTRDAKRDAPLPAPEDAGAADAPIGCTEHPGWIKAHPFRDSCTMQIAPPAMWDSIAYPMVACPNGQPNCTQMVIPRNSNNIPGAYVLPQESEAEGFYFQIDADPESTVCRRAVHIVPTATSYQVKGAIEINLAGTCKATPHPANGEFFLTGVRIPNIMPRSKLVASRWEAYEPRGGVELSDDFAKAMRTGDIAYSHEPNRGKIDIISLSQGKLLRTVYQHPSWQQWDPRFARGGDLYNHISYGQLGKGELWRTDVMGNHNVILQKAGVHIFAPSTDGTTLFWIEASGNEDDLLDQPKVEVWAGPFSKDGAITRAGARRLLDVSGVKLALDSTARNGLYLVGLGGGVEFLVIRARDGAYQRIKLLGDWDGLPAYVDERFIWFNHASPDPKDNSVARIGLDPWPP